MRGTPGERYFNRGGLPWLVECKQWVSVTRRSGIARRATKTVGNREATPAPERERRVVDALALPSVSRPDTEP